MTDTDKSKDEKLEKGLVAIMMQFREEIASSIEERLQFRVGKLTSAKFRSITKHKGAGGKTYVIQANFQTTVAGTVPGGLVLKYAIDLDDEVSNANLLHEILLDRQKEWDAINGSENPVIRRFPEMVFAPKVLATIPDASCLILEFIQDCVPLQESNYLGEKDKYRLLGYGLGRLHGSKTQTPNMRIYAPFMENLRQHVQEKSLNHWTEILENSEGGVEYIHGDSHLHNILVTPSITSDSSSARMSIIDAIILPGLDRMDDIGYALSHDVQEALVSKLRTAEKVDMGQLLTNTIKQRVPLTLSTYKATADISSLYSGGLPVDFFLGAHLIVRAEMWDKRTASYLLEMGKYFIEESPVSSLIKKS